MIEAIIKKRRMLKGFIVILIIQFVGRISIIVASIFVNRFIIAIASESLSLVVGLILAVYFRLREPVSIRLSLQPNGEFSIIRTRPEKKPSGADLEMVLFILLGASRKKCSNSTRAIHCACTRFETNSCQTRIS